MLCPWWASTLRLPRLIGPERALELMLTGDTIDGKSAAAIGLIDAVADDDLLDAAVRFAREQAARLRAQQAEPRRAIDLAVDASRARIALDDARRRIAAAPDRGRARTVLVDCVEAGLIQPREVALEVTAQATRERMASAEANAHRYQFFAQREAARVVGFDARRSMAVSTVSVVADQGLGLLMPLVERLGKTAYRCRLVDPGDAGHATGGDDAGYAAQEMVLVEIEGPRQQALARLGTLDRLWPESVPLVLALRDGPFDATDLPVQPRRPIAGLRPPHDTTARVAEVVALRPGFEPLLGALARLCRQVGWQPIQTRDGARSVTGSLAAVVGREGAPSPVGNDEPWPAALLTALRAAGRQLFEEGQLLRLSDIDVALVTDFGFPAHRGGPFHLEDRSPD